jgi:hypothetical protein
MKDVLLYAIFARNPQPVTRNLQHATRNTQHTNS